MKGNAVRRGSVARYQGDRFQAVEPASPAVPGNPWFICTLWLAQHRIARATTIEELRPARELLEWAAAHALPSGVLAEQLHPRSGPPLSVSPLAWSHAEYVIAYLNYLEKYQSFTACPECGRPHERPEAGGRQSSSALIFRSTYWRSGWPEESNPSPKTGTLSYPYTRSHFETHRSTIRGRRKWVHIGNSG